MRLLVFVLAILSGCGGIVEKGGTSAAPDAAAVDASGSKCGAGSYCSFSDKRCGTAVKACTCQPAPVGCTREWVCGCDGRTYESPCAAYAAGVDLQTTGGCTAPAGSVPCGSRFCDIATTYCTITMNDIDHEPNLNQCIVLPAPCNASSTCACLPKTTACISTCERADAGGLVVTCPGG